MPKVPGASKRRLYFWGSSVFQQRCVRGERSALSNSKWKAVSCRLRKSRGVRLNDECSPSLLGPRTHRRGNVSESQGGTRKNFEVPTDAVMNSRASHSGLGLWNIPYCFGLRRLRNPAPICLSNRTFCTTHKTTTNKKTTLKPTTATSLHFVQRWPVCCSLNRPNTSLVPWLFGRCFSSNIKLAPVAQVIATKPSGTLPTNLNSFCFY